MPTAFVSYSWDSQQHRTWVRSLAERLRSEGVDVKLDQWELEPGDQLPRFMEQAIRENDFVLIVCTPRYKVRSDAREGGVGYEGDIMTAEVFTGGSERKFIPVLREREWVEAAPSWLAGKVYVDLRGDSYSEDAYDELLLAIHGTRPQAPPLGPLPVERLQRRLAAADPSITPSVDPTEPIRITGVIVEDVGTPTNDGTAGSALYEVPFRLSRRPSSLWADVFIQTWDLPPRFTSMHRPGIARVTGDSVVLDETTIDEVQQYHLETLKLAVEEANRIVAQEEEKRMERERREAEKAQQHDERVRDVSKRLKFD